MNALKTTDILFIQKHKRFPITGVIRKQFLFSLFMGLCIGSSICLLSYDWLLTRNYFSDSFLVYCIFGILLLIVVSIVIYLHTKNIRFTIIKTENTMEENIGKVKGYFRSRNILLRQLQEDCYYISSKKLDDWNARELIVFVFAKNEIMMNRMLIHSLWRNALLRVGTSHYNELLLDLSKGK